MIRLLLAEFLKMRRSKIGLVSLSVPAFFFTMFSLGFGGIEERVPWTFLATGGSYAWAYFFLPMTATLLTAMMGQIEYRPNTWSYMLTLPQRKWLVFLTKGVAALLIMAWISVLIVAGTIGAGLLHNHLRPELAFFGVMPWKSMARDFAEMWMAGFLVVAIQFGVAMRFGGLVVPLLVGMVGVFLAVLAGALQQLSFLGIATDDYNFVPWLLPTNMLRTEVGMGAEALLIGGGGGALVFVLISLWLARKDWD